MRDTDFVFGYVDSLCYGCHKKALNKGRSYIDSSK